MPKATLTKRLEFCSSHRYHNPKWDEAKNREVFGPCNNVNTHGHNYLLEVTLCGEIDPVTGMIINLYDLKQHLWDVLIEFDHKNLNLDTPYFTSRIPTSENLAWTLWELLAKHPQLPTLEKIRLYEDASLYAEVTKEFVESPSLNHTALIGRRYRFAAVHQSDQKNSHGHQYELWVGIKGSIPSDTGQIIDLQELDQIVNDLILQRWKQQNISHDPLFSHAPVTDISLAKQCWALLKPHFSTPPLAHISISQQSETFATFSE
ncbi:MAG: 6-carboxytetrahydropterin synthase [Nitrospirota bacterium]|nr:6-carboxytetrahydropterin synthase [Nitrospirota bacterium]MDH5587422.1 6-carboxytetrahydropterin synthase [Nitrospirota bacterium]MDH5774443.1 6-carboxytetrahydropterin synthase [Nitrospirota bacterium]